MHKVLKTLCLINCAYKCLYARTIFAFWTVVTLTARRAKALLAMKLFHEMKLKVLYVLVSILYTVVINVYL